MILVMANSDDLLQQRIASECIIAAANKADKAKAIITQGASILKRLYTSPDEGIKLRALVGLCKLGSSGGSDASIKPFAEGSNLKLAEACRRFLLQPGKDNDMQKWAAEGLSYLTLDAEVSKLQITWLEHHSVLVSDVFVETNLCSIILETNIDWSQPNKNSCRA